MRTKLIAIQELCHFKSDKELKIIARAATKYTAFVAITYNKIFN